MSDVRNEKTASDPEPIGIEVGKEASLTKEHDATTINEGSVELIDFYKPLPIVDGQPEENQRVVTVRAVVLGCLTGALVNAANLYLGLKTGTSIGVNTFGALVGFVVLKSISMKLPENFPILGGFFGVRENSIVQTAAITSGSMSFIFLSGVPATYQLGLLSSDPKDDYWRLVTFTFICAFYGQMFAAPMRTFFLKTVAREMKLIFPATTACTVVMKNLHDQANGLSNSKKQLRVFGWVFLGAFILVVVSQYAKGILMDWHFFTWFYIWGNYSNGALAGESWFWFYKWTPAFHGLGMVVGTNIALSFFFGSVLAWGIIGPALVSQGLAVGVQPYVGTKWAPYTIYGTSTPNPDAPSPYYWMLWPAVMIMICTSITDILVHSVTIWRAMRLAALHLKANISQAISRRRDPGQVSDPDNQLNDTGEEVPWWVWAPGTVVLAILSCVVLALQYNMTVEASIVALLFGFILSFIAIQVQGIADSSPLSAITKLTQFALGGMVRDSNMALADKQLINLAGAQVAGGAAYAATELISDFRFGYLLGTPVIQQFIVQCIGNVFAIFVSPAIFFLYAKAYSCIIEGTQQQCDFPVPAAQAWKAIALAMLSVDFPIPTSSGITAICLGVFSIALSLVKHFYLTGNRAYIKSYLPNMTMVGFAMILPATSFNSAMAVGAAIAYFWTKKWPAAAGFYLFAVASGLIMGESMGGVANAIITIAGGSGSIYGTNIACPLDKC